MNPKKKYLTGKIISNTQVADNIFVMQIELPHIAESALPGQFVMVSVASNTTDPLLNIPLGVFKVEKNIFSILYKVIGSGTKLLSLRKAFENIVILGPLGNWFDIEKHKDKKAVLVAGGVGFAPINFLAEHCLKKNIDVELFFGTSSKSCIPNIIYNLPFKKHISTDDGSYGCSGNVINMLEENFSKEQNHENIVLYASGPNIMLNAVAAFASKFKIKAYLSLEAYMACGIGACMGCAINTKDGMKLCCQSGPVFSSEIIY